MKFSIIWNPVALKFLRKLPKEIAQRIVMKVRELEENPFHYLEHLENSDYYKLRVGDYRLLMDVDFRKKIMMVRVIDHRKNIYKHP